MSTEKPPLINMETEISEREKKFLALFSQIDLEKVGRKVGRGWGHQVYEYGKDLVLKIPSGTSHFITAEQKREEYQTLQEYFPRFVVETQIIQNEKNTSYVLLQRRLNEFKYVYPDNVQTVQSQFDEVIRSNQRLLKDKRMSLEFLGGVGLISTIDAYFSSAKLMVSNVVIETVGNNHQVVIPDFTFLKLDSDAQTSPEKANRLTDAVTFRVTKLAFLKHFGIDIS